ncbi:hypothetical protein L1994_08115 [Methanomicrobium antiquum]|uniref:Uncharacterized protein n=1 Tax=Methanomicrobium antiquum TaxID=487686 RepID=A0AAF0FKD4_9EURY|nr:hypothetical protein [Methanomicrobium antiquum]MDD3977410.1 hypothetical protein [Methanomicrobium sp.]WFN36108.1 hypothetical protein L1994_08115 [Methanomicrobium antiquum]
MKTLELIRDIEKDKVTVKCADKYVSVYSRCAYCKHCEGVLVGKRVIPTPQKEKMSGIKRGTTQDDELLNAAMMFNTLIRDGSAIMCANEKDTGFLSMYTY